MLQHHADDCPAPTPTNKLHRVVKSSANLRVNTLGILHRPFSRALNYLCFSFHNFTLEAILIFDCLLDYRSLKPYHQRKLTKSKLATQY
jgi:hypothetical protein